MIQTNMEILNKCKFKTRSSRHLKDRKPEKRVFVSQAEDSSLKQNYWNSEPPTVTELKSPAEGEKEMFHSV